MNPIAFRVLTSALALATLYSAGPVTAVQIPPPNSRVSPPPPTTATPQDEVRLDTDLVQLEVVVTDEGGNYLEDLRASEMRVLDDGQPRDVAFFAPVRVRNLTRPVDVVLAVDISGSIAPAEVSLQRDAALQFAGLLRAGSRLAVVAFNHEIRVAERLTDDHAKVGRAFDRIRDFGGSTRLYDAIDRCLALLSDAPPSRGGRRVRRVVVVVTDGFDSSSQTEPRAVAQRAAEAGVTIYSITLPSYVRALDGGRTRVPTLLDISQLVPATGGRDYPAESEDFGPVFRDIAEEVSTGYQIAFYPSDAAHRDGKFHKLEVEVLRPGVTVRASRMGYE